MGKGLLDTLYLKRICEFLLWDALLGHLFGVLVFNLYGWLFDSLLVDNLLWAFLLAFSTGHLASRSGAQAARPRASKAEPFISNPKPTVPLYSSINDATSVCLTKYTIPEPSLTSGTLLTIHMHLVVKFHQFFFKMLFPVCSLFSFHSGLGPYESSMKA